MRHCFYDEGRPSINNKTARKRLRIIKLWISRLEIEKVNHNLRQLSKSRTYSKNQTAAANGLRPTSLRPARYQTTKTIAL